MNVLILAATISLLVVVGSLSEKWSDVGWQTMLYFRTGCSTGEPPSTILPTGLSLVPLINDWRGCQA